MTQNLGRVLGAGGTWAKEEGRQENKPLLNVFLKSLQNTSSVQANREGSIRSGTECSLEG